MSFPEQKPTEPEKVSLDENQQAVILAKMAALKDFRAAQARLTEANLQLLQVGLRPNLGEIMCW